MPRFVKSVVIDAPVADVFAFHESPDAFALLTPAFPPVRVISQTGGIREGARVVLRVGPFRWVAVHIAYEKDRLFVDEQIEGPFAKWIHRHEFTVEGAGEGTKTRLTDHVEYEMPGGPVVNALMGWAVKPGLSRMFAHRHRVTRELCEPRAPGSALWPTGPC